jgi:hypothetical protein
MKEKNPASRMGFDKKSGPQFPSTPSWNLSCPPEDTNSYSAGAPSFCPNAQAVRAFQPYVRTCGAEPSPLSRYRDPTKPLRRCFKSVARHGTRSACAFGESRNRSGSKYISEDNVFPCAVTVNPLQVDLSDDAGEGVSEHAFFSRNKGSICSICSGTREEGASIA